MIFTAAGTQDGRGLVRALLDAGYEVAASVVSSYGRKILQGMTDSSSLRIIDEAMDEAALEQYLRQHDVTAFVDATHPYAVNITRNAMTACHAAHVPYIRYERDLSQLTYDRIRIVHSYEEAARAAVEVGQNIFVTTGSRNLVHLVQVLRTLSPTARVIARVLPTVEAMQICEEAGLLPAQIAAMQGPFSLEMNREMYRHYAADVIITKNSGTIGGTDTKLAAAESLGLPVVLIDRPHLDYDYVAHTAQEVIDFVRDVRQ